MNTTKFNSVKLEQALQTRWLGKEIQYFDVTDSTNIQARYLAEKGRSNGTLVIARHQQAGKGRAGRSWDSEADSGIYMTFLLRPKLQPENAFMLTLVAALAVTKAIRKVTNLMVQIKWPNDIVLNGKKICGILTEMSADVKNIHYVLVGVGINISNRQFPSELLAVASSLYLEAGLEIDKIDLIAEVLRAFEEEYDKFSTTEDMSMLCEEYNGYLVNCHKQVRILDPKEPFEGIARGINKRGELVVEVDGLEKQVSSGEVSVRGIYGYV